MIIIFFKILYYLYYHNIKYRAIVMLLLESNEAVLLLTTITCEPVVRKQATSIPSLQLITAPGFLSIVPHVYSAPEEPFNLFNSQITEKDNCTCLPLNCSSCLPGGIEAGTLASGSVRDLAVRQISELHRSYGMWCTRVINIHPSSKTGGR